MIRVYSDCFARIEVHCGVLKEMLCKYGTCPFYKSKEQYEEEKVIYPHLNRCTYRNGKEDKNVR